MTKTKSDLQPMDSLLADLIRQRGERLLAAGERHAADALLAGARGLLLVGGDICGASGVRLLSAEARLSMHDGDLRLSLCQFEDACRLAREEFGDASRQAALVLVEVAETNLMLGYFDDAERDFLEVLAILDSDGGTVDRSSLPARIACAIERATRGARQAREGEAG